MADNRLSCEETELRLGLPINSINYGKRVRYDDDDETSTVDFNLNLNLSSKENDFPKEKNLLTIKPPAKAQVVGWPPVRSFRKNVMAVQKNKDLPETDKGSGVFVKVSVDGAPYLRKVDLKMYRTYQDLSNALAKMFSSFTIGKCDSQGMMDDSKLMDLLNGPDYVPTYEDKDGDWMLVGDVPWEMFVESCKRLRIMKATEARGLAMEKSKFNRS